jgi:hypothetical protein
MDWGVGDAGWGGDALAGYPRLPKSFTNAKTAKKRKHKELFVTEEALLKPVRLGKPVSAGAAAVAGALRRERASVCSASAAAGTCKVHAWKPPIPTGGKASTGGEKPQASRAAANGGDGDGTGGGPKPKKNKNKFKQQQQQQQPQREQEQAQQEQRQQRKKAQDGAQRLVQEQRAEAAKQSVGQPEADEAPRKKKSKNKFKQQLDGTGPLEQQGLLPAQQQQPARGSNEEPQQKHGKKQRSKQERRQQPPDEAVAQPPSSKKQQEHADNGKQRPKQPAGEQQPAGVKPQQGATPEQRQPQQSQQQQQQQQQQPQQSHRGSKLLDKMRARLQGGHFRQLNEALYTRPGADAFSLMAAQPELFGAYHDGFQQQVRGWPLQPVDVAVKWAKAALPRDAVVADFGCGDAKLAASVEQVTATRPRLPWWPWVAGSVQRFDGDGRLRCGVAEVPLGSAMALRGTTSKLASQQPQRRRRCTRSTSSRPRRG